MTRKSNDLIETNEQFVKQRTTSQNREFTPRADSPQKDPGKAGRQYPNLESWSLEELRQHAGRLNIADAERLDREGVIEAIYQHQARMH